MPPRKMLEEIKGVIAELGLIYELPTETKFWRARNHKLCHPLKPPEDFTSPPLDKAIKPNRMSPAGISMFYGADDVDTAAREINPNGIPPGQRASGVCFKSRRPLQILDLMKIVPEKSYFAQEAREWRHGVEFLRRFSRNASVPIVGPAGASEFVQRMREEPLPEVDYVPTQVFTEYVRYHMTHDGKPDGRPIDGIRYRSSLNDDKENHGCYVLFFDQDDCLKSREGRPQSLKYDEKESMKTVFLDHRG
jgi:hypothetical protein